MTSTSVPTTRCTLCRCVNTSGLKSSYNRHIFLTFPSGVFCFLVKVRVSPAWTQLLRAHQWTESRLNSWVALSRTVQPENGDFRLNLRFVSPWNANSPLQIMRRNSKKKKGKKKALKNPVWTVLQCVLMFRKQRCWMICSSDRQLEYFFLYIYILYCLTHQYFTLWFKIAWHYHWNLHFRLYLVPL